MNYVSQYLAAFVLLAAVIYLPGYVFVRTLLGNRAAGPLSLPLTIALGATFWIVIVFALCATQCFHQGVVLTIVSVATAAAGLYWGRGLRWPPDWRRLRLPRFQLELSLLSGTLTCALPVLFLLSLVPVMAWDSDTYHLTLPKLYAAHGGFRLIPFNVYSNWPLNIELLFGLALQLKDWILANQVEFLFGVATVLAIYRFASQRDDRYAGLLAAVLFISNPIVLFEFWVAYVDTAFAFFFFMGFWLLERYAEAPRQGRTWLLMAGICAGILSGIKLTGPTAAGCLGLLCLLLTRKSMTWGHSLRNLLCYFALPCLVMAAPWWIKSWYYTGNPFYPFLYEVFGGPHWSDELAAQFRHWHRSIGMGRGLADYLLLPVRVILLGEPGYARFDGSINRLWIFWLPVAILGARRNPLVRHALIVSFLYFAFWAASSQQMRFLIPILPLLAVATALTIADLLRRVPPGRTQRAIAAGVSLVAVCSLGVLVEFLPAVFSVTGVAIQHGQPAGAQSPEKAPATPGAVRPVLSFINKNLPPDARIMFLNTNHGFFCEREYIADSFFEASQMGALLRQDRTPDALMAQFDSLGITHILWNSTDWKIHYPDSLFVLMDDPSRAKLIYQSSDGADRLYALERQ
jgi:hypothetical protein